MKKALLLILGLFCLLGESSFAQTLVKGKITDSSGPIPGVSIKVKGASTGTTTNIDGEFSILAPADAILVISSVGYTTREVAVKNRSFISETLTSENKELDEVVVVGYGKTKKADIISSVSSISGKELAKYKTPNAAMALQGQMPGVRVLQSSGGPGAQPRIYIRGISTLGGTNPLLIVDGVPITNGFFNSINPSDIERIDVLKDASSAAIYGANSDRLMVLF